MNKPEFEKIADDHLKIGNTYFFKQKSSGEGVVKLLDFNISGKEVEVISGGFNKADGKRFRKGDVMLVQHTGQFYEMKG